MYLRHLSWHLCTWLDRSIFECLTSPYFSSGSAVGVFGGQFLLCVITVLDEHRRRHDLRVPIFGFNIAGHIVHDSGLSESPWGWVRWSKRPYKQQHSLRYQMFSLRLLKLTGKAYVYGRSHATHYIIIRERRLWQTQQDSYTLNLVELLRFILLTLITAPPNYKWQQLLEHTFPGYEVKVQPSLPMTQRNAVGREKNKEEDFSLKPAKPRINVQNTLAKWFIDSITVGTLLNTVAFYVVMGALKGQSTTQIQHNVQTVSLTHMRHLLESQHMDTSRRRPEYLMNVRYWGILCALVEWHADAVGFSKLFRSLLLATKSGR